jgi:DHA2 family multidrug resistance protein-like MFS transporter
MTSLSDAEGPTLASDLDASTSQLQWMANSYNLVLVAAMIVPVALSLITVLFRTEEDRKKAIGFFVVANSIGMPLGPIVGGLLLDHAGWQWIFFMNVPIAVLAVTLLVPETRSSRRPAIDWLGIVLSSAGLAALVYGVTKAGETSWTDAVTVLFLGLAVVLIAGFLLWQRRNREPLIELRLFSEKTFTGGAVLLTVSVFAIFGLLFTMPQYFQGINGSDALHTGLKLLPFIGGMTLGAKLAAPVEATAGTRLVVMTGFVVMAVGFVLGAFTELGTGTGTPRSGSWWSASVSGVRCRRQ